MTNLTTTQKTDQWFLVSWDAPYTLLGVPILEYRVSISGVNRTVPVENSTELCIFSPDHNFTVSVVAVNMAGVSPPAIINVTVEVSSPKSINVTVNPSATSFTCKMYDTIQCTYMYCNLGNVIFRMIIIRW